MIFHIGRRCERPLNRILNYILSGNASTLGRSTFLVISSTNEGSRRSQTSAPVLPPGKFKRPKSSPVRPLACNWYYCAQFIAKPKAACALRFSWAATSSNLGL